MTSEEMDRVAGEYTESLKRLIELVRGTGSYLVFAGPGSKLYDLCLLYYTYMHTILH